MKVECRCQLYQCDATNFIHVCRRQVSYTSNAQQIFGNTEILEDNEIHIYVLKSSKLLTGRIMVSSFGPRSGDNGGLPTAYKKNVNILLYIYTDQI